MLYPQNSDRIVTIDYVTSPHATYYRHRVRVSSMRLQVRGGHVTMNAGRQLDWRESSAGRRVDSPLNDTSLHQALLAAKSSSSSNTADLDYDARGAAVYVCAVISVYALFVVVFVAILFAVRRRRRRRKAPLDGGGRLGGYLVGVGRSRKPPPPPPPPVSARLRSDSSSSVSPAVRRSARARRCRSVAAAAGDRDGRCVDELVAPSRRRSANDVDARRCVSASPVDDVITLIQVTHPTRETNCDH